ncbi:unnamed protein product [Didymodactylos carnosus]|uniref:ATP synthase subunit b n=2 Tax=Didymodactylos carnosus TaxID=1234261 RepID=A0A8S2F0L6_9BILA|nr:unnamed protein product [Didymodactylos carnosus]CAF4173169.1 unnamed protein product [Didymodactylos carnosus]
MLAKFARLPSTSLFRQFSTTAVVLQQPHSGKDVIDKVKDKLSTNSNNSHGGSRSGSDGKKDGNLVKTSSEPASAYSSYPDFSRRFGPTVIDGVREGLENIQWRKEWQGKRLLPHDQWPERDLVNFPPYRVKDVPSKVRWGFVPDSWFTFFYEKTGVTGPYIFLTGVLIHGFSKEWIVLWYDFNEYLALAVVAVVLMKKLGPFLADFSSSVTKKETDIIVNGTQQQKALTGLAISIYEQQIENAKSIDLVAEARKEILNMQLEIIYRERMKQMYDGVKRRLDYQIALQNARKDFERTNMINWITSEVRKAITQKQEQDMVKQCIEALKQMASTTTARQ